MKIASIASGSNGNCYYLENENDAILIDAGISAKQIVQRMANIGLSMSKVRGVFISHEHTDHVRGVDVLSRKYSVQVFMTQKTYSSYGKIINFGEVLLVFMQSQDIVIFINLSHISKLSSVN